MAKADSTVPLVGDVIAGRYRIDSIAGEGGMGIVYEAEHLILRQRVAIKALLPGVAVSPEVVERFSLEASAVARIDCEHVVRIFDAGSLPTGAPYLVMEYLEGADLETVASRRGRLPYAEVVDIGLQSLEALAHAHAAGVIHRDLKPANLFLARRAAGPIVKLLDFGISRAVDALVDDRRVVGSPVYMSPEQLDGGTLDARSDLWSLGVVLYQLVAGEPPFGGTFSELVAAILGSEPKPLRAHDPTIPEGLSSVVARCLRQDPAERFPDTFELAKALVPWGTGAWSGAVDRIDRAISHVLPPRTPRRFESFENALQALETEAHRDRGGGDAGAVSRYPRREDAGVGPVSVRTALTQTLPPSPASSEGKPRLRILLIDDSAVVLGVHARILTASGFEVQATSSPREFDELLSTFQPHLVLMDVQMPEISGDVLCRRVKDRLKATVPVVLLSDMPRDALEARARVAGADAYFAKTSDFGAFVDYVRNICAMTYSPEDLP